MKKDNVKNKNKPTEKQHIVSKFYLENFTNEQAHFYFYNTKTDETNISYPKAICYERFEYEFDKNNPDNTIEKELSNLEGLWATTIRTVINKSTNNNTNEIKLSRNEIENLSQFCVIQYFRTLEGRKQLRKVLFGSMSVLHPFFIYNFNKNLPHINKNNISLYGTIKNDVNCILSKCSIKSFQLYYSEDLLLTSDHPVAIEPVLRSSKKRYFKFCVPLTSHLFLTIDLCYKHKKKDVLQEYTCKIAPMPDQFDGLGRYAFWKDSECFIREQNFTDTLRTCIKEKSKNPCINILRREK